MTRMTSDRAALLFRLQCTLFCIFYGALLFFSIVYFRHRLAFIDDALGTGASLPKLMTFARAMHHPGVLTLAGLAAVALVTFVWVVRPNPTILLAQAVLMLVLICVAFIPPVATEITTSSILSVMHERARERGLID
jgi:hypothetical protein